MATYGHIYQVFSIVVEIYTKGNIKYYYYVIIIPPIDIKLTYKI